MTTMTRVRAWHGPALFSYGFRPFFLFGGIHAALMIAIWVPWFLGFIALPSALPPVAWHAHELLFGYVPAIVAGFLLTAVPNWTGRLPVTGMPLVLLFACWLVGRVSIAVSQYLSQGTTVALSLLFLVALLGVIGREIVAGRNWRNLKVWVAVALLACAQAGFHWEVIETGSPLISSRLAIAATIMLIMIIGGRVTPSFTTNWLRRANPGRLPAPPDRFDEIALAVSGAALIGWIALPLAGAAGPSIGAALLVAAGLNAWRQVRWVPLRTVREPLVLVLHAAYVFITVGFFLAGIGAILDDLGYFQAALHAWTAGAVGLMTLAMMTRASRGHTGHSLTAPAGTIVIYVAVIAAAVSRIAAALVPEHTMLLLPIAGLAWVVAFGGFAALYGPMLWRPRQTH
jgi:uncharacterized protein involved in response to NO